MTLRPGRSQITINPQGHMTVRRRALPLRTSAAAVLLGAATLAASCGSTTTARSGGEAAPTTVPGPNKVGGITSGPADNAPVAGGSVAWGIDAEPEGLNPSRYAFSQSGHMVASAVFEPLATLDENGQAVPYLATAIEPSADNKTWTITLPTGVKFHDGTPLDADAVVASLAAYKTSAIVSTALFMVDTINKTDATHVEIKLNQPIASFPVTLTTQAGYILAPAMHTNTDLAKKPIGTGPFVFDSHEDGKRWSFKKNPTYRRAGLPYLASIDFVPLANPVDRNDKLRTNDLDMISTYTGAQIAELRSSTNKLVENRFGDKAYLSMNTTKPPFDNINARRAVVHATNAERWRKESNAGVPAVANSPYGPGQPGYIENNGYPKFDIEEAKKFAKLYETEVGKPLEFVFLVAEDATNLEIGQKFQADFLSAGMKVTIEPRAQIQLLAAVALGGYQLGQFRVFGSPNPDGDVHFYRTSSITPVVSLNFPRYNNPAVDKAVDEAMATKDGAARATAYEKVNRILADQVPMGWLGQTTWMIAANPRVNGIYKGANGSIATIGPKTWITELSINR